MTKGDPNTDLQTHADAQKKAGPGLLKNEALYHKMVEEVEDYAILLLDENGYIKNWNTGAEKIKGYKEEEILGKHFRIFYLAEDQQHKLPEQLMEEATNKGKALHEGWRLRKDGTAFWGSIVITALHDDAYRVIGFCKVTRDLSERKLKEDQIRQYARDLEQQNRELEQFAYAASHDLKEPLRKIQFYTSALQQNVAAALDEKHQGYLNRTIHAAQRMQKLIEDILAYARTSISEQTELMDLNGIAAEVAALHKEEMQHQDVHIHIGPLPAVRGIVYQFKQLFDNLISNSIKYRHPDRPCEINIAYTLLQQHEKKIPEMHPGVPYHHIRIADNGIGFDQQYGGRIFEIFQRLHPKSDSSGSGVGLAICKKIVQNHNGIISAAGQPDEGAQFDIYLPAT